METPVVYLFYGEDVFGVEQELAAMQGKMGEESLASMNATRIDGKTASLEEMRGAASTVPFLTERRLVVIENSLSRFSHPTSQKKFIQMLESLPGSTALVLWEERTLKPNHWLLRWAEKVKGRAFVRKFGEVRGGEMARWIREQAKAHGGEFSPQAARRLAELVGADKRHGAREIEKLLAFVDYSRPVEEDEVQHLAVGVEEEDSSQIFKMVDALGNKQGKAAMNLLHRLFAQRDALSIFGMVVRQFRLLLLSREILDAGGSEEAIRQKLDLHPFVAQKLAAQAHNFNQPDLEKIYHHLGQLDLGIKTGRVSPETALDTLVASLTVLSPR